MLDQPILARSDDEAVVDLAFITGVIGESCPRCTEKAHAAGVPAPDLEPVMRRFMKDRNQAFLGCSGYTRDDSEGHYAFFPSEFGVETETHWRMLKQKLMEMGYRGNHSLPAFNSSSSSPFKCATPRRAKKLRPASSPLKREPSAFSPVKEEVKEEKPALPMDDYTWLTDMANAIPDRQDGLLIGMATPAKRGHSPTTPTSGTAQKRYKTTSSSSPASPSTSSTSSSAASSASTRLSRAGYTVIDGVILIDSDTEDELPPPKRFAGAVRGAAEEVKGEGKKQEAEVLDLCDSD